MSESDRSRRLKTITIDLRDIFLWSDYKNANFQVLITGSTSDPSTISVICVLPRTQISLDFLKVSNKMDNLCTVLLSTLLAYCCTHGMFSASGKILNIEHMHLHVRHALSSFH